MMYVIDVLGRLLQQRDSELAQALQRIEQLEAALAAKTTEG